MTEDTVESIVPTFRLDGRTCVITGGAGGLALTVSRALLAQGANIALVDLNLEVVEKAAVDLKKWAVGANITNIPKIGGFQCNVADYKRVQAVIVEINEYFDDIPDLLLHTAGYCQNYEALEYPDDKVADLLNVNLLGSYYISKYFAKSLVENNKTGSLILVGSMSGVIINNPQPQTPYNMSKAGVIHLTKSLACEWAKYNIRVNCLSPGYILTPLTKHVIGSNTELKHEWESKIPLGRMAETKEFVGSILYLATNASTYTTGENLVVDGGYQCW